MAGLVLLGAGLTLFGAIRGVALGLQVDAAPAAPPTTIVTDGPTLFRDRGCAHCHEIRGVGGEKGPDLSGVGRRMKKDALERQIALGGDAMPAFGEVLPSQEIAALVQYLHRCRDKHPPAARPAAQPSAGSSDGG